MADAPRTSVPLDRLKIKEAQEVEWWSRQLRMTPEQLRVTVKMVRTILSDVRKESRSNAPINRSCNSARSLPRRNRQYVAG